MFIQDTYRCSLSLVINSSSCPSKCQYCNQQSQKYFHISLLPCHYRAPKELLVHLDPRELLDPRERRDLRDQLALMELMDPRGTWDHKDHPDHLETAPRDQCSTEAEVTLTTFRRLKR